MTKLIDEIRKQNTEQVLIMLKDKTLNINEPDSEGRTPLWWAVNQNLKKIVVELLVRGANIYTKSKSGESPFGLAVSLFNASRGETHFEIINYLLNVWHEDIKLNPSRIDYQDYLGGTLLYWSIHFRDKKKIGWLIKNGANPLIVNEYGISPLLAARLPDLNDPILDYAYELMLKKTFPWMFDSSVPLQARAILNGWRWRRPDNLDALKISYTFDKFTFSPHDPPYRYVTQLDANIASGERVNNDQRTAIETGLRYYSSILRIEFYESPIPEEAQIIFRQLNLIEYGENTAAHTDCVIDTSGYLSQVCINLDTRWLYNPNIIRDIATITENNKSTKQAFYFRFYKAILHELGHALGLKHPKDTYTIVDTIMSYDDSQLIENVFPETIMPNDWLALLSMYQPNTAHRNGNDTYRINGNERHLLLIIDQGGIDVIDVSGFNTNAVIDLRPGMMNAVNKYRFIIAPQIEIENVIGSEIDNTIVDNELDNFIDLSASKGISSILLTSGSDTVKLGSGKAKITINPEMGRGVKKIIGFKLNKDQLSIDNAQNIRESLGSDTIVKAVIVESNTVLVILEGLTVKELPESFFQAIKVKSPTMVCADDVCDSPTDEQDVPDESESEYTNDFIDEDRLRKNIAAQGNYEFHNAPTPYSAPALPLSLSSSRASSHQPLCLPSSTNTNTSQTIMLAMVPGVLQVILALIALYLIYIAFQKSISYAKTISVSFFAPQKNKAQIDQSKSPADGLFIEKPTTVHSPRL